MVCAGLRELCGAWLHVPVTSTTSSQCLLSQDPPATREIAIDFVASRLRFTPYAAATSRTPCYVPKTHHCQGEEPHSAHQCGSQNACSSRRSKGTTRHVVRHDGIERDVRVPGNRCELLGKVGLGGVSTLILCRSLHLILTERHYDVRSLFHRTGAGRCNGNRDRSRKGHTAQVVHLPPSGGEVIGCNRINNEMNRCKVTKGIHASACEHRWNSVLK